MQNPHTNAEKRMPVPSLKNMEGFREKLGKVVKRKVNSRGSETMGLAFVSCTAIGEEIETSLTIHAAMSTTTSLRSETTRFMIASS